MAVIIVATLNSATVSSKKPLNKRIFSAVLYLIIVTTIFGVLGGGAFYWRFSANIPSADYPEPRDIQQARLQDIDYLRNLPQVDYSFSDSEKVSFSEYLDRLETRVNDISNAEFSMSVAAAVAISENGHTFSSTYHSMNQLNSLPVRFFWFADGLYIVRAHANHADLIGARVLTYGGQQPEALVAELDVYHSGTDEFLRHQSPLYFSSPAAMHAAKLIGSPDQVALAIEMSDGSNRNVVLKQEDKATRLMRLNKLVLPIKSKQENDSDYDWQFLDFDTVTQAHFGKNPNKNHWFETLPNAGMYLSLRNNYEAKPLKALMSDVKGQLKTQPADYLVLDLRSNSGGDYTLTMTFMRNLTELIKTDGRVYILTSGATFSAGLVSAAFATHGAGKRGKIVGSHVGDDDQFWAESGALMILPNSGLKVGVSTGYHDWENGCTDWSKCFWVNILMGVAAGPLDPQIKAPLRYEDYSKGIDTTMQAVFAAEGLEYAR